MSVTLLGIYIQNSAHIPCTIHTKTLIESCRDHTTNKECFISLCSTLHGQDISTTNYYLITLLDYRLWFLDSVGYFDAILTPSLFCNLDICGKIVIFEGRNNSIAHHLMQTLDNVGGIFLLHTLRLLNFECLIHLRGAEVNSVSNS